METKQLLKKIRRIQFQSNQLARDLLAGAYHSTFKGRGLEFEDVREYQPGDEIRTIDWHVTARMRHPYVKTFREERELTVFLVVDLSASMQFGSHTQRKRDLIAEIGAALAFSALKNNDKVGLILFTDQIEKYLVPKKGVRHVLRVIRDLLAFEPVSRGTNLNAALSFLGNVQRRSSICFLISDFMADINLKKLAVTARQHDLISITVTDPYEQQFPSLGIAHLTDLESGKTRVVDTSDPQIQHSQELTTNARLLKIKKEMQKIGAGFIDVRTNKPYLSALRKFFKLRELRR